MPHPWTLPQNFNKDLTVFKHNKYQWASGAVLLGFSAWLSSRTLRDSLMALAGAVFILVYHTLETLGDEE